MSYRLEAGDEVLFESVSPKELADHLVENFPPDGAFPSPYMLNGGFAIALPNGERLQGLQAARWVLRNR